MWGHIPIPQSVFIAGCLITDTGTILHVLLPLPSHSSLKLMVILSVSMETIILLLLALGVWFEC